MIPEQEKSVRLNMLLESHAILKQIMQNVDQVVWVQDQRDDQLVYASPAFETVWGRSREALYADPTLLIKSVHPEDRVMVMSVSLDHHRRSADQTYRIHRPDGSLRWIAAHFFLIDDAASATTYQVCVAQDISEHSQTDQTLRKALDRSRELFTLSRRMSLARKPEAVLNTLMSASEFRFARQALVLFSESMPGGSSREIEAIASWSHASSHRNRHAIQVLNETSLLEDTSFFKLLHPSKPVIISQIEKDQRISPSVRELLEAAQIKSAAMFPLIALGKWLGALVVFFPESRRFELAALRHIKVLVDQATITLYNLQLLEVEAESRHEAERANEIKTRFLAMISHELRTPLTSIIGFTTTLLAEDVDWSPEEERDFVQTIQQEADRLQELIDHLLDLSRLEAGMLPITLKPHLLQAVIDNALPQIQALARDHRLEIRLPANLPPVLVDEKRIAQVMVNLVHNAVQNAPIGTEVAITCAAHAEMMKVSISDEGPGISPADRKHVFQPFWRGVGAENNPEKGAGLGLAICKGLVEAQGGRIWIKRQSAPGTTISFTVPLADQVDTNRIAHEG